MIRRKYFFLITFIFSFLVNSSFSQEILVSEGRKFSVFDLEAKSIYKIDLENQEFRILTEKRNLGPFKLTLENVKFEDIDQSILVNSFKNSAGEIYVSILGTGQIYQLNVKSRIFRRIDKTFYRGYNFFAIPLIRKDTIYSIGGYGFWHINNVPTFFDLKLNEWELMPNYFNEEMPLRVVSKFGGYHLLEDKLYVAEVKEPYLERAQLPIPFFQFDFKKKKWTKLGTIKSLPSSFLQFDHLELRWTGQFFFSNEFTSPHFIDPSTNKQYKYIGNKKSFFSLTTLLVSKGDYLYSFLQLNNKNQDKIILDSMAVKTLLKDSVQVGNLYEPVSILDHINYYMIGIVLLIIVLLFQFWEIRKYKMNQSYNNGMNKSKELPEFSLEFLTFMMSQENHTCTTEELNTILQCHDKSIESQRQIRAKFISSLNIWIENEYQVAEAVTRIPSEFDRRFVNYKISNQGLVPINQLLKTK